MNSGRSGQADGRAAEVGCGYIEVLIDRSSNAFLHRQASRVQADVDLEKLYEQRKCANADPPVIHFFPALIVQLAYQSLDVHEVEDEIEEKYAAWNGQ